MQNTLSIRYDFCSCDYGILCYLEPCIVFKAKLTRHVRIKNNSWLRRFFCQLTHGWPGEYLSVVSCGLSVTAFVLLLSLFIYEKCHAHSACPRTTCSSSYYFRRHVFVNILIRVIKQNQTNCFYEKNDDRG